MTREKESDSLDHKKKKEEKKNSLWEMILNGLASWFFSS